MKIDALVLSCEHGGNVVPVRFARHFESRRAQAALKSHRGYDIGALPMAKTLRKRFGVRLIYGTVTRLLVEPNRSLGHPQLFSEFSAALGDREREHVLHAYYQRHRQRVETEVRRHVERGLRTLHLSVHSFTPRFEGRTRNIDLGLLYDPARGGERRLCAEWATVLRSLAPDLRVRRNAPYRGRSDGLTTSLRGLFGARYLGIELETNQALLSARHRRHITRVVGESLSRVLAGSHPRLR